ncbi:prepilin-type N-terminal cleavage/methylation domain-containing protein [Anaerobranca californiensis DSM 14826]|jgi:prepilin-type N-terminal cleavage/methylation domain-containing protein|uniref:Prepilin-type N-terminal cleavage/methylation domain-containing protein n=1 Tax=Anaerobranca californiensis DSM 14826 TaxID=1120989 RepID=A0A1M6LJX2_9FIRM|nr:prepilin-type N-terminal cleavage/methylation domain-containing protein [Anaerobranca californiensis]SHJ71483.1 prepilin-type N-terminal cleavage/methylation domain-containing protein [Anaerobranca californiensis DSM 14826]
MFKNIKGLTLVELIVTIAILSLVATIAYPMVASSQTLAYRQINNSHDRNDLRLAMSYLNNDIKYSTDAIVFEDGNELRLISLNGDTIIYKFEEGNRLIRQRGETNIETVKFLGIIEGTFDIQSSTPSLVSITLATEDKETSFSVARFNYSLVLKDKDNGIINEENIIDFITNRKTYFIAKTFGITNNVHFQTVLGNPGAIYIKPEGGTYELQQLNASNNINIDIFIDGNLSLNAQNIRLHGNLYVNGNVYCNGYKFHPSSSVRIYYTGGKGSCNPNTSNIKEIIKIETFPKLSLPKLREDNWYNQNGYQNSTALSNGKKYFFTNDVTLNLSGNVSNVIIVSKGNISITIPNNSQLQALIFAPNGKVTLNGNNMTFEGLIIANEVNIPGNSVTIKYNENVLPNSPDDYPFEIGEENE